MQNPKDVNCAEATTGLGITQGLEFPGPAVSICNVIRRGWKQNNPGWKQNNRGSVHGMYRSECWYGSRV
eukprot:63568-Hanusia_phi.AAC.1